MDNRMSKIDEMDVEDYIKFLEYKEKYPTMFTPVALVDHKFNTEHYYSYVDDEGERVYFTYSLSSFSDVMTEIYNSRNKKEFVEFVNTHKYFFESKNNNNSLSAEFTWYFMTKIEDNEIKIREDYKKLIESDHIKWNINKILDEDEE